MRENMDDYQQALNRLHGRSRIQLHVGNTYLAMSEDRSAVSVTYHWTPIITFRADGLIILDGGGWIRHVTTQHRFNGCMPGTWYTRLIKGVPVLSVDGIEYLWPNDYITVDGNKVYYGRGADLVPAKLFAADIITRIMGAEVSTAADIAKLLGTSTIESLNTLWRNEFCRPFVASFAPPDLLPLLLDKPYGFIETLERRIKEGAHDYQHLEVAQVS